MTTTLIQPKVIAMWEQMKDGEVPATAVPYGHEADGTPLWVARAIYNEGVHPGKVRPAFKAANIPYGGQEIKVNPYEVFKGSEKCIWKAASGGQVPEGAIVFGREKDGTPLYVARAEYMGGVHLGKVRPGFSGANIPYGGKEITIPNYEVLTIVEKVTIE